MAHQRRNGGSSISPVNVSPRTSSLRTRSRPNWTPESQHGEQLPLTVKDESESKHRRKRHHRYLVRIAHALRSRRKETSTILVCMGVASLMFIVLRGMRGMPRVLRALPSTSIAMATTVSFIWTPNSKLSSQSVLPPPFDDENIERSKIPNYGGLEMSFFIEEGARRAIYHDYMLDETRRQRADRLQGEKGERTMDNYYAFDDDYMRNPVMRSSDGPKLAEKQRCRRTNWHRHTPINCNGFHEFDLQSLYGDGRTMYVGHGAYRDVYLTDLDNNETVVYKTFGPHANFDLADFEYMRMDCLVAERLSGSPQIVDIYGFCGLGHIGEAMPHGDFSRVATPLGGRVPVKLDEEHLDPKNDLLPGHKLDFAHQMAEPIALLHGYSGGVMVHDDIQLSQYLFTHDGTLKLNDFNRAEIMLWDEEHQMYCGYRNNPGNGDWRAPEEYYDNYLNEKIDVYSLGNNLYATLTGLFPYYKTLDVEAAKKLVKYGNRPYIDPRWRERSFAERKIAEAIDLCLEPDSEKRPSIFEIVQFLREAAKENEKHRLEDDTKVYEQYKNR